MICGHFLRFPTIYEFGLECRENFWNFSVALETFTWELRYMIYDSFWKFTIHDIRKSKFLLRASLITVRFTGKDSWRDARERKSAEKYEVFGEAVEKGRR